MCQIARNALLLMLSTAVGACGDDPQSQPAITITINDQTSDWQTAACWDIRVTGPNGAVVSAQGQRAGGTLPSICGGTRSVVSCEGPESPHTVTVWLNRFEDASQFFDPCPDGCTLETTCGASVAVAPILAGPVFLGGTDSVVKSGPLTCDGVFRSCESDALGEGSLLIVEDRRLEVPVAPRNWRTCTDADGCDGVPQGDPVFPDGTRANPNLGNTLPSITAGVSCGHSLGGPATTLAASDIFVTCGAATGVIPVAESIEKENTHGMLWVSGTHVQWQLSSSVENLALSGTPFQNARVDLALALDTAGSGETCALSWLVAGARDRETFTTPAAENAIALLPAFRFGGQTPVSDADGSVCFRDSLAASSGGATVEATFRPGEETSSDTALRLLVTTGR